MAALPELPVTVINLVYSILGILGTIFAFFVGLWYWSLDRKIAQYDSDLKSDIRKNTAFRGIQEAAEPSYIYTSPSSASKFAAQAQKLQGVWSEKPDKIVVTTGDTFEERKVEMIRERCREIPGKSILDTELVAAIRNHYAHKLALSREDVDSDVVEHFKTKLTAYEYSSRVEELAKPSTYDDITLLTENPESNEKDALDDVFLRLVRGTEQYCIRPITDVDEQRREINRCRSLLMLAFFGLYAHSLMGAEVHGDIAEDDYENAFLTDVRDENNWGYWLLPDDDCMEEEFRRIRHLAWSVKGVLEDYWDDDSFSELFPPGESVREMEYVEMPFIVFQKEEEEIRGGGYSGGQE